MLSPRGAANAYGQAYRVLAPQQWTREAAHAVDPGYYVEPEPLEDTDGWLTRVFYKVKKLAQTGDAATLLCLILASSVSWKGQLRLPFRQSTAVSRRVLPSMPFA